MNKIIGVLRDGSWLSAARIRRLATAAILVIALAIRLWQQGDPRLQGAGLCLGALLATPFALDYDLMAVAPAILLLAGYETEQRIPFGATLLSLLWMAPLFSRAIAGVTAIPLANWVLISGFLTIIKRAR